MPVIRPTLFLALALWMSAGTAFAWPQEQARLGADNHPAILARFGGETGNANLRDYVTRIGGALAQVTPDAAEPWTFTVLDTPAVNAFAMPGGYVYVTRGMLALANSEAQIAAVIGHEMAHVTARHGTKRQERGNKAGIGVLIGTALGGLLGGKDGLREGIELSARLAQGYVAQFSQKQEFEADRIGTRYLSAAGYDPHAQAQVLASLAEKQILEARIAGKSYNPNRVDFFGTHPATSDRVAKAADLARTLPGTRIGKADYLAAIDGMIYGDSPAQGFVRGRRFVHPEIGFEFWVPEGFVITNSTRSVRAEGPNGAKFILDSGGRSTGRLPDYIRDVWLKQIEREYGGGRFYGLHEYERDGYRAATAMVEFTLRGEPTTAHLTLIDFNGSFHRLSGVAGREDWETLFALAEAARSYRSLTRQEAADERPYRIKIQQVGRRDRVAGLARHMPFAPYNEAVFRTLNGLGDAELVPGDLVKMITD